MSLPPIQDLYPQSPAFLELPALRIPAGWRIGWNTLRAGMGAALGQVDAVTLFNATHDDRRFNIDIEGRAGIDADGSFHLTVLYQPWPRTGRGRRLASASLVFTGEAEVVQAFETRDYAAVLNELEHWLARCSVWAREGS